MKHIIEAIKAEKQTPTVDSLKAFIQQFNIDEYNYKQHLKAPEREGDYGRNIFTLDPFECVLINWPAGVESGIHHHDGLFGYVLVLEGEIENVCYRETEGKLEEYSIKRFGPGALIYEADGVIHKIKNAREDAPAVSIHFYYPPLKTLGSMRLFDTQSGSIGILSDEAKTASWCEDDGHFSHIDRSIFKFLSFDELNKSKSHIISNVIPKPLPNRIGEMNADYFCEQAEQYDFYDFNLPKRKSYIDTIDELIAKAIADHHPQNLIDIACGTGRRAVKIKKESGVDYAISGIDISEKMCEEARNRGIDAHHEDWLTSEEHSDERFDCATFLYAFGHIPNAETRLETLKKIHAHLNSGGLFCFDVFNLDDKNEWGPLATKAFEDENLGEHGYELGDVFYRKNGFKSAAFVHYFSYDEVTKMLETVGFKLRATYTIGYSKNAGDLCNDRTSGNFLFVVEKV